MTTMLNDLSLETLLQMYRRMVELRQFEERVRFLFLEGIMPGTIHQYIGQEACAVGVCSALEEDDVITSTHRPHGHALARGISIRDAMAELFAKTTGCCHGKGGSMHLGDLDKGVLPAIAIVGGGIPVATGIALSFKLRKQPNVAVSFFGDGATNEGAFHEGVNIGAIWDLPILYVCENNLYGASTAISKTLKLDDIADRAAAYGIPGVKCDGNDVVAVLAAAKGAIDRARSGGGPTLLELKTFRTCGHSRRDPSKYQTEEEKEAWGARDPIKLFQAKLIEAGHFTADDVSQMLKEVEAEIDEAIEFAQSSPDPKPEDALCDVFA